MGKAMKPQTEEVAVGLPLIDPDAEHVYAPQAPSRFPCKVCSTPGATARSDGLCWVCRRLKISAWQGSDAQDAMVEE